MEGDTLLADDRSFPYSDKDVELICGSLIIVRKGVLQVIHLTVKEFLRSPQERRGCTSSSLLIDPDYGSLQLTLVCLRCIAKHAEPLVNLESKVQQIDWALDPDALEKCRARAPLLEYASFSWLVHSIDCKLDDLVKITPTFQKTFSSLTTFSWIETCMASQPDSALRLLVGLDDVHDTLYGSRQGLRPQQVASSQFLTSWCSAMSQVLEEYGAVLARRPWEIYLIDLYDIFSVDPSLRKMWQESGNTSLREKDLHLNGYQAPGPQHGKPPPHLQLQQKLQSRSSDSHSIFLVHDEVRNIYIWGETEIEGDGYCIYVQHGSTGQRLPPAEDLSVRPGRRWWRLIDHALSPNGWYIVLFYGPRTSEFLESSHIYGLTVAWQINETINFKRRMNCEPWAKVVFSHRSDFAPFEDCSRAIMFKDDNCCITPIGTLDLLTGSRLPLPDNVTSWIGMAGGLFFSCNGQYLFASNIYQPSDNSISRARRAHLVEPSHAVDFCWEDKRRCLVDVSPSGQYLVLEVLQLFPETETEDSTLYLHDTNLNVTLELPLPKSLNYWESKFDFSRDETRLTAFLVGRDASLTVTIWGCLSPEPRLTSHARLYLDSSVRLQGIYVHKAANSAIIVTRTRSMQRIGFGDSIELLDRSKFIDDHPHRLSTISRDSSHWALVRYGKKSGKVQITDLASPDASARHFDIEWSNSDITEILAQGTSLPVGVSPDLRVLIVNAEVFDLTRTTNGKDLSESLTLTPFTMEAAPALLKLHQYQFEAWGLECQISSCNSYILYTSQGDQWGSRSRYSSAIYLFRIDLQTRTSARLELALPDNLISLHASFHPSLPLMAISYASPTETELTNIQEKPPSLRLAICDLTSLEMTVLETPKGQTTEIMER